MERTRVESPSHYGDLMRAIAEEQGLNLQGTPISTIDSLMPRSNQAPFAEGETFSGNVYKGRAEVSLTLAASPHFRPVIPLKDFLATVSRAFGQEAKFPGELPAGQKIAPHMIVWWQAHHEGREAQTNLFALSAMPPEERANFISGINAQVVKAFSALRNIEGRPIIYGSWGHSEPDSRARFGFSRGAPTLPDGHLHLAKVNEHDQMISLSTLPAVPTLKHYQPWNRLINRQLGPNIAKALDAISRSNSWDVVKDIHFYDYKVTHSSSHLSHQQGYEVTYQGPVAFESAMEHIVCIADNIEGLYQRMSSLYAEYYKSAGDRESQRHIFEQMQEVGIRSGFDSQAAERLARFVVRITPTSSQLNEWAAQLRQGTIPAEASLALDIMQRQLERRARLMAKDKGVDSSISAALVKDTYRNPKKHEMVHTWPAHSSAIYLFDDIEINGDSVAIKKFSIHPAIVSAAGAPEKILGAAVMRDMGSLA